jgi:hypothetical protein
MLAGRSYDQIASAVGYANRGTAHRVVAKALAQRLVDDVDQLREFELAGWTPSKRRCGLRRRRVT